MGRTKGWDGMEWNGGMHVFLGVRLRCRIGFFFPFRGTLSLERIRAEIWGRISK